MIKIYMAGGVMLMVLKQFAAHKIETINSDCETT